MKKPLILALSLISTSLQAQTYTQVLWGYNAASTTPINYKNGVTWFPLSVSIMGYVSPGTGAATNKTAAQFLDDLAYDVNFFSNVNPNTATNSSTGINAAILAANNIGGGVVRFPAGNNYNLTSAITLQKGSNLLGSFPTTPTDSTSPYLLGSRLTAATNMSSIVTQPSLTASTHSMSLNGMTIEGKKSSYSVTNLVDWAPINSYMTNNYIVDGTGNCIRHKANSGASWIDWYLNNTIGNCTGSGLLFEGSDSFIIGNYFSGNGANITMNSSGSIIANNQIEVSTGDGIATGNNPVTPLYFQVAPWVGNYFTQNAGYDIHYLDPGASFSARSPVVGNTFHASNGVKFENNTKDALFVGDYFSDGSGSNDIAFTNSTNTGVQIIGTSHTKSVASRFSNLPSDAQVISGGPGGAYNRLQSLVVSNPATNVGVETAAPRLNVYGNDTILGQANTAARFGISRNSSGFDGALLLGVSGGNAPFISCANGELTAVVACSLYFNSTLVWGATATNFTSYIPMIVGSNGFTQGSIGLKGVTSGTATITSQAVAGTPTLTLPNTSGTLVSTASAPLSINATTGAVSITGAAGQILAGATPAFTATPTLGVNATTTGTLGLANGGTTGATVTLQNNGATTAYNFNLPTTAGTSGQPLLSGGGGSTAMTWGARSGSTTTFGTTSGTLTNGHCVSIDASGNLVDAGGACTTGGGGGTVNSGTIGQLAYYASTGTAVSGSYSPTIGVAGTSTGSIAFANATSGSVTLQPTTGALGASVLTLPATTGTVTVLGNTTTGSGSIVLATSPSIASPTFTGTVAGAGTIPLTVLATQAANTVVGNATSGAASPTALSMTSCSTAGSAVSWTTNTGFGCNTSITAAAVPATGVTAGALGSTVTINNSNWSGTQLSLTNGGTNASLTASNGGIIYSTASALAVLSGTATANQHLASGASGAPSWTTATFPATTSAGTILASGSANTVTAIATPTLGVNATTTGTLGLANGGATGATVTLQNNGATTAYNFNLPTTVGTAGYLLTSQAGGTSAMTWTSPTTTVNGQSCTLGSTCTVTAVASSLPIPSTVTGTFTSGGIPFFNGTNQIASSGLLAANALVIGGGAGVAPATTTTGTGVVTAIGNNTNTAGGLVVPTAALGSGQIVLGGGSGASPTTSANASIATGALTLGAAGTQGSVIMGGSTSGTLQLKPAATAGTGSVLTFPGGTTDFSATGGTSQVVKQTSAGGAFTVAQLAASDLSNGTTGSNSVVLATSPTLVTPVLGVATGTSLALGGATIGANALAVTGTTALSSTLTSAGHVITDATANALAVGANGSTGPALKVDVSTGTPVTGLQIKAGANTGGLALSLISNGASANENLTIDAKGSGTITLGSVSTGNTILNNSASFANGTVSNPSITNTGNLNVGMWFPAANTVAFSSNSLERMRIDASGRIFMGSNSYIQVNPYSANEIYNLYGTNGIGFQMGDFTNNQFGTAINMAKSRGASIGTNTIVQNGDALGNFYFNGANGTGYSFAAGFSAAVDGTPSLTSMPGRIDFKTTPSGSTSLVTRMSIGNGGNVTFSYAMVAGGTAPTATGAGGTCAAGAVAGGATAGTVTLTAACASTNTLALTVMPTAPTGYVCDAADRTNKTLNLVQSATTTTSATFTFNATTGATDVIQYKCTAY